MCGHAFHYECINRWLKNSKNCPLCNSNWEFQKTMDKNVVNNTTDKTTTFTESVTQTPSVSINVTSTNLDNIPISPIQSTNEISEMIIDDDEDNNDVSWDNSNSSWNNNSNNGW